MFFVALPSFFSVSIFGTTVIYLSDAGLTKNSTSCLCLYIDCRDEGVELEAVKVWLAESLCSGIWGEEGGDLIDITPERCFLELYQGVGHSEAGAFGQGFVFCLFEGAEDAFQVLR